MFSSELLRVGILLGFLFVIHHEAPHLQEQTKFDWNNQYYVPRSKQFLHPVLQLSFHWGSHVNKTVTQVSIICILVSYYLWHGLYFQIITLVIIFWRRNGSNHNWHLLVAPVPYQCFNSYRGGCGFCGSSLAHF